MQQLVETLKQECGELQQQIKVKKEENAQQVEEQK